MVANFPPTTETEKERGRQQLGRFLRRFQPSYRLLAYYAALPLVLTPDLLNHLRTEFLRGEGVPWVAEIDLLLSDLCRPVGYEQYVMEAAVRAALLADMTQELGQPQVEAAARLLVSYLGQLTHLNSWEQKVQQWAALAYIDDKRITVVQELAQAYQRATDLERAVEQGHSIRAELDRLTRITDELKPQLQDFPDLLAYADLVRRVLISPTKVAPEAFYQTYEPVAGVALQLPSSLAPEGVVMPGLPPLQTAEFETVTLEVIEDEEAEEAVAEPLELTTVEFETAQVDWVTAKGRQRTLEIRRDMGLAQQWREWLPEEVALDMVLVPAGEFWMGAAEGEQGASPDEYPRHRVRVPSFFMGKYAVTQAQWRSVAAMPRVNRDLKPDPSRFKGANRPVERVSWHEAVEFCARLSAYTGRDYRLPSEAEWEYACRASPIQSEGEPGSGEVWRAGTETPFYFGPTLTTDLANYRGTSTYADGPRGVYREETVDVGSFFPNGLGLYEMHGNVWEWCADPWHGSYEGAPNDGSVWDVNRDTESQIIRGGSWLNDPVLCRSALRSRNNPDLQLNLLGFRVAWCPGSAWVPRP